MCGGKQMNKSTKRLATLSVSAGLLLGLGLAQNTDIFEPCSAQAATYNVKLTKNSYVYTAKGKKNSKKLKKGKTYKVFGKKEINGKWYYNLGNSTYIRVANAKRAADTYNVKLTKNSYIYSANGKKTTGKLKKGKTYKVYGKKKINGKWYYDLGNSRYIKAVNATKVIVVKPTDDSSSKQSSSSSASSTYTSSSSSSSTATLPISSSSSASGSSESSESSASSESSDDALDTMAKQFSPDFEDIKIVKNTKADPKDAVDLDKLPEGTTAKWEKEPDTSKYGHKEYNLILTYPDGSQHIKSIGVDVVTQAGKNGLLSKSDADDSDVVELNEDLQPKDRIDNWDLNRLPKGIAFSWIKKPDTSTTGVKPYIIEVTYSDGSKDIVKGKVTILTLAEKYEASFNWTSVKKYDSVDPKDVVEAGYGKDTLPEGTTFSWIKAPDTSKNGVQSVSVEVTYSDGSKSTVEGSIDVY